MDCGLFTLPQYSLPFTVNKTLLSSTPSFTLQSSLFRSKKPLVLVANNSSQSHCEFSGLKVPLVPKTPTGKLLSSVFLNDRDCFHVVVEKQLKQLAYERDSAIGRMNLSFASDEALLHRRIAELKEMECRNAVEDVMYMLIVYKFSEIRVHLVPRLSTCMFNGRLEIWPCRDWDLESIHCSEVLEMVREHLSTVLGWTEKSNVRDNWTPTQVQRLQLCHVYAASILYGYFLKSASLRHHLEQSLQCINSDFAITTSSNLLLSESWPFKQNSVPFGDSSGLNSTPLGQISLTQGKKPENFRSYIMSFNHETMQMCAKPKCKEALDLIEKHCCALFGDEKTGPPKSDETVSTSLASLKRFVLEAIAFGSFLWDSEDHIRTIYKLEEN